MSNTRVIFKRGAWDPFHIGHLNVLQTAANLGDILVVGVATDDHIRAYKHREPFCPFCDRIRILSELRCVDFVVPYSGPEDMVPIDLFHVNVLVVEQLFGKGDSSHAIRQRKAGKLLQPYAISAEVLDLRTIAPLDEAAIKRSVAKTGRVAVFDIGWQRFGLASEIARVLQMPLVSFGQKWEHTPGGCFREYEHYPRPNQVVDELLRSFTNGR